MSSPYNTPNPPGGGGNGNGAPPGQNMLCVCLALLAAVLGTPALFQLVGPVIKEMVYKAYDSRDLAMLMYFASFGLSGIVIFAICRMALFYAIGAIVAFATLRFGGGLPMAAF